MPYTFITPTYKVPMAAPGRDRLYSRFSIEAGFAVLLRTDGSYEQTTLIDPDRTDVQKVYGGGRVHTVSDEEAASLTAAGYGPFLTRVVP